MSLELRSAKEYVSLIGDIKHQITGKKLPSTRQMLSVSFYNLREVKLNVSIFHLKRSTEHHFGANDRIVTERTGFFVSPLSPYDESEFLKWSRSCASELIMVFLYKAKKNYLRAVAEELGIAVTEKMIQSQIIKEIMASEHFEEQLVLNILEEEEEKRKEELEGKRKKEAL
ncbi:hypothetical protein AVEN_75257-1 [Araneus ventricosus]|uniref:Uncharacterized protein n=1 Tax=Araneus ventricosus TaxID=182803 RepID=A0A4Y2I8L4_ARAVE|nr:hypothetical protein AVEN_75257-1 [Araneus ventricosus]